MTWLKIDDGWRNNPKVSHLSMAARGLWVTCANYCAEQLTDGHISMKQVRKEGGTPAQIRDLIANRLWIRCESHHDCIAFHDWLDHQPSRESVLKARENAAERKRKSREKKSTEQDISQNVTANVTRESHEMSQGESHEPPHARTRRPDPTRPVSKEQPRSAAPTASVTPARNEQHAETVHVEPDPKPAPPARKHETADLTLVSTIVGRDIPRRVRMQLAGHVAELRREGTNTSDLSAALTEWAQRPGAGPGLFPHLVADAARTRRTPATPTTGAATAKAKGWIDPALREQAHALIGQTRPALPPPTDPEPDPDDHEAHNAWKLRTVAALAEQQRRNPGA